MSPGSAIRFVARWLRRLLVLCVAVLSAIVVALALAAQKQFDGVSFARPSGPLVLMNATVIDVAMGHAEPGRMIAIDSGRISTITDATQAGEMLLQPDATVVDLDGAYVVPGYWDMHVHIGGKIAPSVDFPLYVVNGVTGIRDMSDCPEPSDALLACVAEKRLWSSEVEAGLRLGPRVVGVGSFFINELDRPTAGKPQSEDEVSADSARALMTLVTERGYDFVKVYDRLPKAHFAALMAEAREAGIEVSGHVPWAVSRTEAVEAGMRTIEHARFFPIACSEAESDLVSSPRRPDAALLQKAVSTFSQQACHQLMDEMTAAGTVLVPTHTTRYVDVVALDQAFLEAPHFEFINPLVRYFAGSAAKTFARRYPGDDGRRLLERFYRLGLEQTAVARQRGVTILAGTDANDRYQVPGFSLHEEFGHLQAAGLSPIDVLRATTLQPACYSGRQNDYGLVEEGMVADLVILRDDPLLDASNLGSIDGVVLAGRYLDRQTLDTSLAAAKEEANAFTTSTFILARGIYGELTK